MPMLETKIAWENGDVNWSRKIATTGKYWYTIQNRCGIWKDTFVISQDSAPKSVLPKQMSLCNGSNAFLDGTQMGKGEYQYRWEDGTKVPTSWVSGSAIKMLKTWNLCGSINDTVNVVSRECNCTFWVPNAFTPNDNGQNEIFKPVMEGFDEDKYTLYIFNRWGEQIFRSTDIGTGWDGKYNSHLVQEDVYVYKILYSVNNESGVLSKKERIGSIAVIY